MESSLIRVGPGNLLGRKGRSRQSAYLSFLRYSKYQRTLVLSCMTKILKANIGPYSPFFGPTDAAILNRKLALWSVEVKTNMHESGKIKPP